MKGLVNDTIWLRSKDGGEVRMSMGGYAPEEVEKLKAAYAKSAEWEVISHETTTKSENEFLEFLKGPFFRGILFGIVCHAVVTGLLRLFLT